MPRGVRALVHMGVGTLRPHGPQRLCVHWYVQRSLADIVGCW